ncbi:533_t:CDS:2 [Acaulospora morrowiae]|uniref:533_t:CDS:1 n=1 Tax=Acaulospora morrowiae TaxID=94023 RepID=A0A9N8W2V5_9GLOM|nr:533_t:CDS:2 [Acaulospora morrowiae]
MSNLFTFYEFEKTLPGRLVERQENLFALLLCELGTLSGPVRRKIDSYGRILASGLRSKVVLFAAIFLDHDIETVLLRLRQLLVIATSTVYLLNEKIV